MPRRVRIEGYAIVTADGMIADRNRQTARDFPTIPRGDVRTRNYLDGCGVRSGSVTSPMTPIA